MPKKSKKDKRSKDKRSRILNKNKKKASKSRKSMGGKSDSLRVRKVGFATIPTLKPKQSTCDDLFLRKSTNKWKDLPANQKSLKTKLVYSLCKRNYKNLYQAYKSSLSENSKQSKRVTGILFDPIMQTMNDNTAILFSNRVKEIHQWLDVHGWTEANVAKAQKMKQQFLVNYGKQK